MIVIMRLPVGAGMFVTSVVVGSIAFVKPFKAMARPFLRDIIFYIIAVYWAFFMLWKEKVYFEETIGNDHTPSLYLL